VQTNGSVRNYAITRDGFTHAAQLSCVDQACCWGRGRRSLDRESVVVDVGEQLSSRKAPTLYICPKSLVRDSAVERGVVILYGLVERTDSAFTVTTVHRLACFTELPPRNANFWFKRKSLRYALRVHLADGFEAVDRAGRVRCSGRRGRRGSCRRAALLVAFVLCADSIDVTHDFEAAVVLDNDPSRWRVNSSDVALVAVTCSDDDADSQLVPAHVAQNVVGESTATADAWLHARTPCRRRRRRYRRFWRRQPIRRASAVEKFTLPRRKRRFTAVWARLWRTVEWVGRSFAVTVSEHRLHGVVPVEEQDAALDIVAVRAEDRVVVVAVGIDDVAVR
jgi:hypothetical protein